MGQLESRQGANLERPYRIARAEGQGKVYMQTKAIIVPACSF
jgi:hypothetical protein